MEQADLMRSAANLLEVRKKKIPPQVHEKLTTEDITVRIFKGRSIRLYADILNFLAGEIQRGDAYSHYFLLPHTRTLLDIFSRFVRLQECDSVKQALICIGYQLKTCRWEIPLYSNALKLYGPFLSEKGVLFPQDPALFDERDHIWKRDLSFGKMKDLLEIQRVKDLSIYTRDVFVGGVVDKMYGPFSEFVHGNPYQYTGESHNERFWVAATTISTTAYFIELIDRYTLDWQKPADARMWLGAANKARLKLIDLWRLQIAKRQQST